ncbi:nuclease [Burkholderia ubonensis]|uniref:VRR-NUC domain-containing protein n=1 Tax=Burkholderia ubonensis TaxID=101571 RepID=A0AB74D8I3_9BURK|nr:VRR-NUC domain-containing protein [Burkholderia ubonensis]PAJ81728.1 nuclease [Burkholderia ubonensis]PAJ99256.1 nuclease [Burkholderia ubonensis]RQP75165.1 VRR-NUC domain-containing protein [Burkholderia ubonensis]RQP92414.1 VRR-NUC domain-containing protein [Burkholderia ubonensis]
MGGSLQPAGACETIKERVPEYALLPPGTKGYLQEKVEKALKTAKYVPVKLRDGSIVHRLLMQSAMSVPMMIEEEFKWKWLFKYKAEVSFDMMPFFATGGVAAPIPFLSNEKPHGTERRRSRNPFPPGAKVGALRRPDVIIVESEAILWPGRGTVDREGGHHANNMLRLVEVKFPGDNWGPGQEEAYRAISGDFKNRMTVIDVTDCNGDLQKIPKPAPIPAPKTEDEKERQRVPIRSVPAVPHHVWYEDWWQKAHEFGEEVEQAVAPVWDAVHRGYSYLSAETSAFLHQHAAWMFTAGQWVADKAHSAWVWVDETGHEIFRYTAAQLKAGWEAIVRMTDMTWDVLTHIDWAQVGVTLLKGAAIAVAIVVGVAIVILLLPELIAIFAALCAIIAAGAEAAAALAATLGVVVGGGSAVAALSAS